MNVFQRHTTLLTWQLAALALAAAATFVPAGAIAQPASVSKPTVVLVHGAFAESSSWDNVTSRLLEKGYPVIAVANPLRGLKSDAGYVANVIDVIDGPVVLVGHSYGGSVISNAATGKRNVRALVYVAGFAPDEGESSAGLANALPGSTLGPALGPAVLLADGNKDLYILQERFRDQFAADVRPSEARLMAAAQRPITAAAIDEPAGKPAWSSVPSWFVYGSLDKNIPPAVHEFMAKRAKSRTTMVVSGASHVVMVSHPDAVVQIIEQAAASTRLP